MIIELAPTTDPTERSNSPAIISIPIGIAMMPSSAAVSSQPATPSVLRKPFLPASTAKNANTTIAEMTPPASGRSRRRRTSPGRTAFPASVLASSPRLDERCSVGGFGVGFGHVTLAQ